MNVEAFVTMLNDQTGFSDDDITLLFFMKNELVEALGPTDPMNQYLDSLSSL